MKAKDIIVDFGERIFIILLAAPFMIAIYNEIPAHPLSVLIAISESLAIVLVLIRKPGAIATSAYPLAIAFIGTAMGLLVRPTDTALAPELITGSIMAIGLAINISAKLALNRSFGLVAANRGVKQGGPYKLVRHPMYLGYFVTQLGFLLSSFSWFNLAIYVVAWVFQVLRIIEEERFLSEDPEYRAFMIRVPRRILPWF